MNTIGNNLVIAEFMGYILYPKFQRWSKPENVVKAKDGALASSEWIDDFKYHSDWNVLIDACKKWDNLYRTARFKRNIAVKYVELCDELDDKVTCYEILPAFEQLTENIQWLNSINPSNKLHKA